MQSSFGFSHPWRPAENLRSGAVGLLRFLPLPFLLGLLLTIPIGAQRGPRIEAMWPQPAAVGEVVTLRVAETRGASRALRVLFGSTPAPVLDVVGQEILVRVPKVREQQMVSVEVGNRRSPSVPFEVRPTVVVEPIVDGSVQANLVMTVVGTKASVPIEVTSLEPQRGLVEAGGGETDPTLAKGLVSVLTFSVGGQGNRAGATLLSSGGDLPEVHARIQPPTSDWGCQPPPSLVPEVWEVVPYRATPGEPITVRGRGFGDPSRTDVQPLEVSVGGAPAEVLSQHPNELLVLIPTEAKGGEVLVGRGAMSSDPLTFHLLPILQLTTNRQELRKGETATITARLLGTDQPTELTAIMTTPGIARLESRAQSGRFFTSGGEHNTVSFRVRGQRRGRFELVCAALPEPNAPARLQPSDETPPRNLAEDVGVTKGAPSLAPASEPQPRIQTGFTPWDKVGIESVDWAGRRQTQNPRGLDWQILPESLGRVSAEGFEVTPRQDPVCGVAIGRDPNNLNVQPVTIPIGGLGPRLVFQAAPDDAPPPAAAPGPCDWRKVCIDVFVFADRVGDKYSLGFTTVFNREVGRYRVRELSVPAASFSLANGGMANITAAPGAAPLIENIKLTLAKMGRPYAKCCVWFELGKVYAVDATQAKVSADGTTLSSWVRGGEDPELHAGRKVRTPEGELSFLDAAGRFVKDHSGLDANKCLKIFVGRGFTGGGNEAGKADAPGSYAVFDQGRFHPGDSGFVCSHEVGHCLMGSDHWTRKQGQGAREFNCMEEREPGLRHSANDLFLDEATQCKKIHERAKEIGVAQAPPASRRRPPSERESGEDPGAGSDSGESKAGDPETDEGPTSGEEEPNDEQKECKCDEPTLATSGLEQVANLRDGGKATVKATFTTCCATVKLTAVVERVRLGSYTFEWTLEILETRPDCFVSFELDRYFNSKRFTFAVGGGTVGQAVQVKKVEFKDLGGNRFEMRGDGGFQLDYAPFSGRISDRNLDKTKSTDLNSQRAARTWLLLLGGSVTCKDGEAIRKFPFYFRFQRERIGPVQLEVVSKSLEGDLVPRAARRRLVRKRVGGTQ